MELGLDYRIYKYYTIECRVGHGSYGEVYKAVDKKTNQIVAIKKIVDAFQNIIDAKRTYRECAYLLQLNHPCIIPLYHVFTIES
jgi:mitogen-activated protein kinase 15